jgi:hypothetical protein
MIDAPAMHARPRDRRSPMVDAAMWAANSGAAMSYIGVSIDGAVNNDSAKH